MQELAIRTLNNLMISTALEEDGKVPLALRKRIIPPIEQCKPTPLHQVAKGLPIECYDSEWYNRRPLNLRKSVEAKLAVVFPLNAAEFFSGEGDDKRSSRKLTEWYGSQRFSAYKILSEADEHSSEEDEEGESDGSEDGDFASESTASRSFHGSDDEDFTDKLVDIDVDELAGLQAESAEAMEIKRQQLQVVLNMAEPPQTVTHEVFT
jgi:hypothetical protein